MIESPPPSAQPATVCTFYSYKGGVGRSMAVANVGVVMAMEGHRVLLVDWDLEAPGLEMYFRKGSHLTGDPDTTPGVVDLLEAHAKREPLAWTDCVMRAEFFGRSLDLISAGSRSGDYRRRVQQLNWDQLFQEHRIGNRINQLREEWRAAYDFVLIDSRTGITDIGDICTVLLPDILVLMFVANQQNVDGIRDAMARAVKARSKLPVNRSKLLGVPIPARDERDREYDKSVEWQKTFASTFGDLYREWLPKEVTPADALNKLYIPYIAAWSFGERIPVIESDRERSDPSSIGAAYARLGTLLAHRLDWYAINGGASVDELVGTRVELSKAREERQIAETLVAVTKRRARKWIVGFALVFVCIALGGVGWYRTRPQSVPTDLLVGDRLRNEGDLAGSIRVYEARKRLLEESAARSPTDVSVSHELGIVLNRFGDVQQRQGKLSEALSSFQEAKPIWEKLVARNRENTRWQRELSVTHGRIGGVLDAQGKLADAIASYQVGKSILDKVLDKEPDNTDWQREQSAMLGRIGDTREAQGRLAEALEAFLISKSMADKLVASEPANSDWQLELSERHVRIGGVRIAQGRPTDALASFQAGKAIMDRLVAGDLDNTDWQRELSVCDFQIGRALEAQGKLAEALAAYLVGIAGMEKLVVRVPVNTDWQRELSTMRNRIGRVLQAQGKFVEALALFQSDIVVMEGLVAKSPEIAGWQRDLSAALKFTGRLRVEMQQPTEALLALDRAAAISARQELVAYADAQLDMIEIQRFRVDAFLSRNDIMSARIACKQGKAAASRVALNDGNRLFWEPSLTAFDMACIEVAQREGDSSYALKAMLRAAAHLRELEAMSPDSHEVRRESARANRRVVELRIPPAPAPK